MSVSTAVLFPGQGTQRPGMGRAWVDDPAWSVVDQVNAALGEDVGRLIVDADETELGRTREAQLAILLTSLIAWEALRPRLTGTPVVFGGHSLGQVTALIAAGALSLEAGVQFAARRAELTQRAADDHPGRMAALLGATIEQAEAACESTDECWIANDNAPGQVVIAGTTAGLDTAGAAAKDLGVKRVTPLKVGGAFHTPLMNDAAKGLIDVLREVTIADPIAPIVSNDDAVAYADADGWTERLAEHVCRPVQWRTSLLTVAGLGATEVFEVGHGSMLAALIKRTLDDVPVMGIAEPTDLPAERN
jgi:[acyl-carrier-protein] S-malonyltransferase